jgi:hypothetical protein
MPITTRTIKSTPSVTIVLKLLSSIKNAFAVPDVTANIISSKEYFRASDKFPPKYISEISFAALDSILAIKNEDHFVRAIAINALDKKSARIMVATIGIVSTLTLGNCMPPISRLGPTSDLSEMSVATEVARYPMAAMAAMSRNVRAERRVRSVNQTVFSKLVMKEILILMDLSTPKV